MYGLGADGFPPDMPEDLKRLLTDLRKAVGISDEEGRVMMEKAFKESQEKRLFAEKIQKIEEGSKARGLSPRDWVRGESIKASEIDEWMQAAIRVEAFQKGLVPGTPEGFEGFFEILVQEFPEEAHAMKVTSAVCKAHAVGEVSEEDHTSMHAMSDAGDWLGILSDSRFRKWNSYWDLYNGIPEEELDEDEEQESDSVSGNSEASQNQNQETKQFGDVSSPRKEKEETLSTPSKQKKVVLADIERFGSKIILPVGMEIPDAMDQLDRELRKQEETVEISEIIVCHPYDGARALVRVLEEEFGYVNAEKTPGFFGSTPPQMLSVEIGYKESITVPWGRMTVPGIDGHLETSHAGRDGSIVFRLSATVKRKHEAKVTEVARMVRRYVEENSIYRGKFFRIRFFNDEREKLPLPNISFLDHTQVDESKLVYPDKTIRSIRTSIWTPITRSAMCREIGLPLKRGVLLHGPYGTGKTLAAYVTAQKAVANGWTFIYLDDARDIPHAMRFAQQYAPAVIFAEDIERVCGSDRDDQANEILNTIDGVDTKGHPIMVILTSNHADQINKALLRAGRLDDVIEVPLPDAATVEKLVRVYAGEELAQDENLTALGQELAGTRAAGVAEIVKRAKLAAISEVPEGTDVSSVRITARSLETSAESMKAHNRLLEDKVPDKRSDVEKAAEIRRQGDEALANALGNLAAVAVQGPGPYPAGDMLNVLGSGVEPGSLVNTN